MSIDGDAVVAWVRRLLTGKRSRTGTVLSVAAPPPGKPAALTLYAVRVDGGEVEELARAELRKLPRKRGRK